jgi:hypothetical protein
MSSAEANPTATPQPGRELESGGGLPFGKTLARVAIIPLRRWKLSLVICVLSAAAAFAAGKKWAEYSYPAQGRLLYRPAALPDNVKTVHSPLNKLTVRDLLKTEKHYVALCREFGLDLPPQTLNVCFAIDDKIPEESELIGVSLEWGDADEGARLVNRLMELLRDQVAELRNDDIRKALAGTEEARKEWKETLRVADEAYAAFLREKGVSDPKADLARLRGDYETLAKERDAALARQRSKEEQVRLLEDEVRRLRKRQEEGAGDLAGGGDEYQKNKRDLELQLFETQSKLGDDERRLRARRAEFDNIQPLVEMRIRLASELQVIGLDIKSLEGSVRNGEARIKALKADLQQNKPHSAEIQRNLTRIQGLKDELTDIRTEVNQRAGQLQVAREAMTRVEKVKAEADPKVNEIQLAQKTYQELTNRAQELADLLSVTRFEIAITTPAAPALYGSSPNRKKVMLRGFLIPLLSLFGVMIAYDMASKSWRAESLAGALDLPLLARASPGASGRKLSPTECRGLSLRLRQYVPEAGGVILFSSLNDGSGVDRLVADLSSYFAIRDEKVLIIDARIANDQSDELQRLLGRPTVAGPVEVAPGTDARGGRGLVQYLVFERQSPWDLVTSTRSPAVDFLPTGGPYPITDALASEPMRELLDTFRKKYTLILVVGPAVSRSIDTEILAAYAGGMVVILNEPLHSFTPATRSFYQSLREAQVPLLGSVLCV